MEDKSIKIVVIWAKNDGINIKTDGKKVKGD